MYKYMKQMLAMAERVGSVEILKMGDWLPGQERIYATGRTEDGGSYELELIIKEAPDADS